MLNAIIIDLKLKTIKIMSKRFPFLQNLWRVQIHLT